MATHLICVFAYDFTQDEDSVFHDERQTSRNCQKAVTLWEDHQNKGERSTIIAAAGISPTYKEWQALRDMKPYVESLGCDKINALKGPTFNTEGEVKAFVEEISSVYKLTQGEDLVIHVIGHVRFQMARVRLLFWWHLPRNIRENVSFRWYFIPWKAWKAVPYEILAIPCNIGRIMGRQIKLPRL